MMPLLGRHDVHSANDRCRRTGTLWERRDKACPVEDGADLMHRHRDIALNPPRVVVIADPADGLRLSHRCNTLRAHDPLMSYRHSYLSLSRDPGERRQCDRAFAMDAIAIDASQ